MQLVCEDAMSHDPRVRLKDLLTTRVGWASQNGLICPALANATASTR